MSNFGWNKALQNMYCNTVLVVKTDTGTIEINKDTGKVTVSNRLETTIDELKLIVEMYEQQ
jgi:hypothetical protein